MSAISVRHVSKLWGATRAVDDVSFEAPVGKLLVLLGPSGCGKSTTLRLIAGLESVSAGRIHIGDEDVTDRPPARRQIAMVFQSYALFPHLSVAENIVFGLRVRRVAAAERRRRLARVAELLGLERLLDRKPSQLSGGQQQRVALGRAIIAEKPVCLMDEPLSNLDAQLRLEMRREIRGLQQKLGITMVYVTHDQTEAMTMGDRICVMQAGRIMQVATPKELYNRPANLFVAGFIGSPEMNLVDATLQGGELQIGGQRLALGAHLERRLSARPAEAVLGMRPQHLSLVADGPGLSARLSNAEFMGHEVYLHADLEGRKLVSVVGAAEFEALGQSDVIRLRPDPDHLHVFDKTDGRNVSL